MRFWDSSAVLPLFIEQHYSAEVKAVANHVPEMVLWWGTSLEVFAATSRLRREGGISVEEESRVNAAVDELRDMSHEIQPSEHVRLLATRVLRTHPLRTADALQLAAALAWAGTPRGAVFVTLDTRLARAARLEGFAVAPDILPGES